MVRAAVFDLDGTLGDTLPLCVEAFRRVVRDRTGQVLEDGDITCHFGPSDRGVLRVLLPGEDVEALEREFMHHYASLHGELAPAPFPEVRGMLEELRSCGIRLAMVTGKDPESAEATLNAYALRGFFPRVETGSPDKVVKGECLRRLLDDWGILPEEAVYVGDAVSDVVACREAGVPIIAAAWASSADEAALRAANPDFLLTDISGLLPLISKL